jgi:hypothetical protein
MTSPLKMLARRSRSQQHTLTAMSISWLSERRRTPDTGAIGDDCARGSGEANERVSDIGNRTAFWKTDHKRAILRGAVIEESIA